MANSMHPVPALYFPSRALDLCASLPFALFLTVALSQHSRLHSLNQQHSCSVPLPSITPIFTSLSLSVSSFLHCLSLSPPAYPPFLSLSRRGSSRCATCL
eukprot:5805597-Pleurochrysis_carterae.AAC.1